MPDPILYEINTRCWLNALSVRHGRSIDLNTVPDDEFARWQEFGLTHIWLMGTWTTGPRSRQHALCNPALRARYAEILPDWSEADVGGSPYAIAAYAVPSQLGGETGLQQFRHRLDHLGLKLVLDFVPNHVGLDHPWVTERPELLVHSTVQAPGTFRQETKQGPRWIAHGKDPWFPAWTDTVQLDYRNPATHAAMIEVLQSVAARCEGVRCDMTMLVLNDVFARNWQHLPCPTVSPATEFWTGAIASVKRTRPDFLFLAESYWDLESRLQALGFDFTYDKRLYDAVVQRKSDNVQSRLFAVGPGFVARSAHFLENHDEPRIASLLGFEEHRVAALLVLGLPGMRLLHDGQLTGAKIHVPVQLNRAPLEPQDSEISTLYSHLLKALRRRPASAG